MHTEMSNKVGTVIRLTALLVKCFFFYAFFILHFKVMLSLAGLQLR